MYDFVYKYRNLTAGLWGRSSRIVVFTGFSAVFVYKNHLLATRSSRTVLRPGGIGDLGPSAAER
jgi:hypothetical protein